MFQKLVSHNDDLRRLVERGYAVDFDSNYLLVRDIPYLDSSLELRQGALVTKLEPVDQERVKQTDHQVFFAGSHPVGLDGNPIPNLGGGETQLPLSPRAADVVVERSFSNKPMATGAFRDFFDKIESYVAIISGPAIEKFGVSPLTFRSVPESDDASVFKVRDTLTSRAEITDLSAKFAEDVVAIIGLGGTGAYLLDFLVKTPVKEIRGFDLDAFHVHNAFRAPGQLNPAKEFGKSKADVYRARYESFRHGLCFKPLFVDSGSTTELDGVTFAFVCVDKGPARAEIFQVLIDSHIPFIDVGMGLERKQGALNGMMRMTYFPVEDADAIRDKGWSELGEGANDLYRTNIQIGELNALNACLAIIRFKQLRGFYLDEVSPYHMLFGIGDFGLVKEDSLASEERGEV